MNTAQAKSTLSSLIELAIATDDRGDVVQRDVHLRTIEDLPLPVAYVREALRRHSLLKVYRGPK